MKIYFVFLIQMLKKWCLLAVLLSCSLAFFYFHLYDYLNYETLKTYQFVAQKWTSDHYASAVSSYLSIYILMIACAIPCATLLALLGGFLFGEVAFLYAVFSTTLGGCILFLATRIAIGAHIAKKTSGWMKSMEQGFQQNAFQYLLMLRLIPIFPCWISNISAGALNVPLSIFIWATFLGIMPATFIYVMVGRGLEEFLSSGHLNWNMLLNPSLFFPLLGLTLMSLFPVFYKSIKKYQQNK